ncbi:MAG: flagellar biosynthetic protein FliO [Rickettsiales bacterium]|nr:flagellar biosynthetic protein FliO [Rickettsiales bacterium]
MEYAGIGRIILSFFFVLALMLGIAWLLKRLRVDERLQARQLRRHGKLLIEETLHIDAKRRLVVVGCAAQRYLLLLSAHGDVTLGALPPVEEKTDAAS